VTSYTYQWKDDGVAISGATASTYVLTASEVGATITCTVTATNEGGSASATSAGVGPVEANESFIGANVKKAADQTTADYSAGAVVAWTSETEDVGGWHDNATNNSRLTVPAGYGITRVRVLFNVQLGLLASPTTISLRIHKNGSASFDEHALITNNNTAADREMILPTLSMPATAGDYFEAFLVSSDASITVEAASCFVIDATHKAGSPSWVGANVTRATDATGVNPSGGYTIPWTSELTDTGGWHDNVTNNTRLTVPSGYNISHVRIWAMVRIANGGIGDRVYIRFLKNGASSYAGVAEQQYPMFATTADYVLVSATVPAVAGDYFEAQMITTDTSLDVLSTSRMMIEAVQFEGVA
jgi:hypothetical protein